MAKVFEGKELETARQSAEKIVGQWEKEDCETYLSMGGGIDHSVECLRKMVLLSMEDSNYFDLHQTCEICDDGSINDVAD